MGKITLKWDATSRARNVLSYQTQEAARTVCLFRSDHEIAAVVAVSRRPGSMMEGIAEDRHRLGVPFR